MKDQESLYNPKLELGKGALNGYLPESNKMYSFFISCDGTSQHFRHQRTIASPRILAAPAIAMRAPPVAAGAPPVETELSLASKEKDENTKNGYLSYKCDLSR